MNEAFVRETIHKMPLSSGVAFDIGANIGVYSVLLAEKFRRVYAFEPHPDNLKAMRHTIGILSNVTVIPKAINEVSGMINLYTNENPGGHSIASSMPAKGEWGHSPNTFITVQAVTIDAFVAAHNITDLHLIKMDIEGAEDFVFNGAINTLHTQSPDILLEVHQTVKCNALFDFFVNRMYYNVFDASMTCVKSIEHDAHYFLQKETHQ